MRIFAQALLLTAACLSCMSCVAGGEISSPPGAEGGSAGAVGGGGDTAAGGTSGGTPSGGSGAVGTGAGGGGGASGTGAAGTSGTGAGGGATGGAAPGGGGTGLTAGHTCGGAPAAGGSGGNAVPLVGTCDDCMKGLLETDVDCGSVPTFDSGCGPCALGQTCDSDDDCAEGVCEGAPLRCSTCSNGQQDAAETGPDCGGICGPCEEGVGCAVVNDCFSRNCTTEGVCGASCGNSCLDITISGFSINEDDRDKCNLYIGCWAANGCGPTDPCSERDSTCGSNTLGTGDSPRAVAAEVWAAPPCTP